MPVYLFTFHAYLSWLPDREQGYVERGKGVLPQNIDRAREYREAATHEAVVFGDADGWTMIDESERLCIEERWKLYEVAVTSTHVHLLVGWRSNDKYPRIAQRLKQRLGCALSKAKDQRGPWFSSKGSRKHVRDQRHFDHLMKTYLPNHGPLRYTLRKQNPNSCG